MISRERLVRLVGVLFRIRPAEMPPVLVLFAWCFCMIGAIWLTRAVRDSLFLANASAARLPYMYVASPLSVSAVGFGYARVADRFRRERLVIATSLLVAAGLGGARLAMGMTRSHAVYYGLYVGADVAASLAAMQFWTVAGEQFTARDAKRLIGLIAAGGTSANIVIGFGVSGLAHHAGTENLLFVCAGLFLLTGALALVLARMFGGRLGRAARRRQVGRDARGLDAPGAGHLRTVAWIAVCTVITVTVIDFQFKSITAAALHGDHVAMVRFFGLLAGVTGSVALAIQLGVTGRLLARVGVAGVLGILPVLLGLGAVGLLILPGLAVATYAKACDNTLRYTLHEAGMQLVYLPVSSQVRARVKATIDVVIRPGVEAMVGVGLLLARSFKIALAPLAGVAVVSAAGWTLAAARLRGAYVASLRETLRRRRVDLQHARAVRELAGLLEPTAAVEGPPVGELIGRIGEGRGIAELLAASGAGIEPAIAAVLSDAAAAPHKRRNAARALGLIATPEAAEALVTALSAEDETVRGAVCQSLGRAHRRNPALPVARKALLEACDRDLHVAFEALAAAEGLGRSDTGMSSDGKRAARPWRSGDPEGAATLIARSLHERTERARDRIFTLLEILHPEQRLDDVGRSLADADPARRANAIEVLDSVLDRRLRRTLVPLIDDTPRYLKLSAVQGLIEVPRRTRDVWLAILLGDSSAWMIACAAFYAGTHDVAGLGDRLAALRDHPSPVVRESVATALDRLKVAS